MSRKPSSQTVTLREAERALIVAAELVDLYGEIYLPLFERLEAGLIALHRRSAAISRATRIAKTGDLSAYRLKPSDRS